MAILEVGNFYDALAPWYHLIVRAAYDASGASAIGRAGVLQPLLREASCLTHHVSANQVSYELTGRVRCGIDKLNFRI